MVPTITGGRALRATLAGTGMRDTPPEAWAALLRDYLAHPADPLSDVVKRHAIRYSAAVEALRRQGARGHAAAVSAVAECARAVARWRAGADFATWQASPPGYPLWGLSGDHARYRHAEALRATGKAARFRPRLLAWCVAIGAEAPPPVTVPPFPGDAPAAGAAVLTFRPSPAAARAPGECAEVVSLAAYRARRLMAGVPSCLAPGGSPEAG